MPSLNAMSYMVAGGAGALALGTLAHRRAQRRDDLDRGDRLGMAASAAGIGAAGGLALRYLGASRIAGGAKMLGRAAMGVGKAAAANPGRAAFRALGRENFGLKSASFLKGPLKAFGIIGAAAGVLAYGAHRQHSQTQSEDVSVRERGLSMGHRERLGMLGATGDMVFGLNNMRHG